MRTMTIEFYNELNGSLMFADGLSFNEFNELTKYVRRRIDELEAADYAYAWDNEKRYIITPSDYERLEN